MLIETGVWISSRINHGCFCFQSYEAAAKIERQTYKEQMAEYKAQLTPAQEEALKEEKRRKVAKRRATRKKRVSI